MLKLVSNVIKKSRFAQRVHRRYVQPYLPQYELETYILRGVTFDQCVDVGANLGIYSVLLSYRSNRVYAFEPVPHTFEMLSALHIRNVIAYNLALGSQNGKMDISLPTIGGKGALALATLRPLSEDQVEKADTQEVSVVKFDDLESGIDFSRIDFIKIDVEGFEMEVLRGMKRLLASRRPALMIEIERRHNPNYLDVFEYLCGLSYEPYITVDGIELRRLDVGELPDLQSSERLGKDGSRTFRRGEHKNYINNFFFLQPYQKSKFRVTDYESNVPRDLS